MFWLSYESFSILSDVFCQKSVISSKNICDFQIQAICTAMDSQVFSSGLL